MVLRPHLLLDPEETLLSYTDRLSLMHTGRGMERLLADLGIHKEHFVSGRADAVAILAEATGHAVEDLQRHAIRVFQRGASFRGEDISKSFLSPRAARYCPACLAADGTKEERRHRLLWGFRHVNRCHKHGLLLAETPMKDATNLRIALGNSPLAQAKAADCETLEYLDWIRERVHSEPWAHDPWLDGQTTEQVLAASEMLGAILEHGHWVAVTKLTPAQTEEATDIGFTIYREGRQAIEEALDTIRQTSPATAVQAGPLAYYGKLFDWLDRRSNAIDPGPIRDILRDHIVKHSAVEPGTTVLGVEITERRFYTIYSLSAEVGIDRPRLSRLLKKLGQVPENATELESGNMVFEAATTVPLVKAFNTAVPLHDVPEYLGASKRQVEILYRAGIVKPLVPRAGRGSVRHVVFARNHLDDLLRRLNAIPELDEVSGANLQPIADACQRGAGPFGGVFADALAGRITCRRHPGKSGIGSIYVDLNSIIRMKMST
ncbi:TniQ family protein [Defluviimonas sp. WL0024]|uniref:TniQ family protein n=1 Tax=Albidovulum salinarum TaxID=2984153 RepID=A0ABT2X1J3_9RHOB|nr:TniQ family protein [Defluviimonas sp. WL0024]MCU9847815.1 TniQ family protein [Defluviimonas sp. WL0024]